MSGSPAGVQADSRARWGLDHRAGVSCLDPTKTRGHYILAWMSALGFARDVRLVTWADDGAGDSSFNQASSQCL